MGLRSPSSSPVKSCCSLRCSEAVVRLVKCSFRAVYGLSVGGLSNRSLLHRKPWSQGGHHIIKLRFLRCDAAAGKLSFDLGEPEFRINRPERGKLEVNETVEMSPPDAPLPVEGTTPEVEELPLPDSDELPSVDIAGKRSLKRRGHQCSEQLTIILFWTQYKCTQLAN